MKRLQSIQYSLCRIIFRKSRYSKDHMSPYLKALHWLPLQQRIKFKQFCLIYKIVNHGRPSYFSPFFVKHSSGQFTRRSSAESVFLNRDIVPFNRGIHRSKTQFDHCFSRMPLSDGTIFLPTSAVLLPCVVSALGSRHFSLIKLSQHSSTAQPHLHFGDELCMSPDYDSCTLRRFRIIGRIR